MKLCEFFTIMALAVCPSLAKADFDLHDFEGNYVSVIATPGTPNITAINPQTAPTDTVIVRSHINKDGTGTVDFLSASTFFGPISSPNNLTTFRTFDGQTGSGFPLKVVLKDKKKGTGVLKSFYPTPDRVIEFDFIVIKKKKGKILKFAANFVKPTTTIVGALSFITYRQEG